VKQAGARIVVVLGMHRSGTSLITRSLQVLGVSLGDHLMPPADGNNAKGFFEDIDIAELNIALLASLGRDWQSLQALEAADFDRLDREGWTEKALAILRAKLRTGTLFGFKDPRTAKLLPFWQNVFAAGGLSASYLLALRNPASVADSLASRDGMPRERSYYLWLEHVLNSLAGTLGSAPTLVDYDDFFGDADGVLDRMAAGLGLAVDPAEREEFRNEFVDEALRHTVHGEDDLVSDPGCPPLVVEVYQGLKQALRDRAALDTPPLRASLARWNAEYERTRAALRLADGRPAELVQAAPDAAALEVLKAVARSAPQVLHNVFDPQWYGQAYPDVFEAGLDLFRHYSETGVHEDRRPGPDVLQAAQRALLDLAEGRDADAGAIALEQARRTERSLAELTLLQRQLDEALARRAEHEAAWAAQEREAAQAAAELVRRHAAELESARQADAARELGLAAVQQRLEEERAGVQRQLDEALERRAEREAAWAAQEREAAQAATELVRRHAAELESVRQAGAAREQAVAEARERAEARLGQVLEQAAAGAEAMRREHAEWVAGFTRLGERQHAQAQQQLAELERMARQRETTLQAAHADDAARLRRERDEAEAQWAERLEHERAAAAAERAALAAELAAAQAELARIRGSLAWRAVAPFVRKKT
jgi:hypothetical protein